MKITQAAATTVIIAFVFALLVLGKDLLIPMVLAIFIWYLINILTDSIAMLRVKQFKLPRFVCFLLALVIIFGSLTLFTNLISTSINNVIRTAPTYQENVEKLIDNGSKLVGLEESPQLNELIRKIDFSKILQELGGTFAGFIGNAGLILIYTLFIFLEQKGFLPKIDHMVSKENQRDKVRNILKRIYNDTKTYIGIKTFTSLLTGVISYLIMKKIGLDFALFWRIVQ